MKKKKSISANLKKRARCGLLFASLSNNNFELRPEVAANMCRVYIVKNLINPIYMRKIFLTCLLPFPEYLLMS